MSENSLLDDDHDSGGVQGKTENSLGDETSENRLLLIWERLTRAGLGETVFRLGTHLLSFALVLIVVWAMRSFYLRAQKQNAGLPKQSALAAPLNSPLPSPTPTELPLQLPEYIGMAFSFESGIPRLAMLHTDIPTRPRTEVITYTVQKGDTIFGIAEKFNLIPETILWGNTYTLGDNLDNLTPGQVLNILPLNGTYHRWSAGEGLNGVAKGYDVTVDVILNWSGNHLNKATIGDFANPNIEPGTMLIVPGGHRAIVTWSGPRISRDSPASAKILGPGYCGTVVDGVVGTGTFIWPANNHWLSGYDYSSIHHGIDIAGRLGDPIYASDNGVIVYAGWNNWGYGNVIVIDHGYGWQTLYAHLSYVGVGCGYSVYQGDVIGSFGSTGNSSGPHLHFEMLNEQYGYVNPHDFLPAP